MDEKARFWLEVLTDVKAPENAAQAMPVRSMEIRDWKSRVDSIAMLTMGPNIPTTEVIAQLR